MGNLQIHLILYLQKCEGFLTRIFCNMNADLAISLSFSPCITRINIEKPSLSKNASSAGGNSLVRPGRKIGGKKQLNSAL